MSPKTTRSAASVVILPALAIWFTPVIGWTQAPPDTPQATVTIRQPMVAVGSVPALAQADLRPLGQANSHLLSDTSVSTARSPQVRAEVVGFFVGAILGAIVGASHAPAGDWESASNDNLGGVSWNTARAAVTIAWGIAGAAIGGISLGLVTRGIVVTARF